MEYDQEKPSRSLEEYWAIARRRRWWLVLPLFLTWALVLAASRLIPAKYRSETVIIVEQQQIPDRYVLSNGTIDVQERLQSMTQQILSRTRLQGIIHRFRLYGENQQSVNSDAAVERMRQDIKIDFVPSPGRPWELSAFKVSYSAPSPALAQQVAKELISLFIDENLRDRQRMSESTTEFLDSQLQQAGKELALQEQRLEEFKSQHLGELPEQLQNNAQILSALQTRLQTAEEAVDEANQQELYLESLLAQYQGLHPHLEGQTGQVTINPATVEEQLSRLNAELADLSSRYTLDHPDVRRVKEKIAVTEKLQRQLAADAQSRKVNGPQEGAAHASRPPELPGGAPTLQFEGQIQANKIKIAHRAQEVKRLESQIADYQRRLNLTPLREQELAVITRDHDQSRANYESLLAKKTQSEMAANLEKRQQGELFSIIDPPNFPQKPYWPDRFKFSLLGLTLGALLAAAITALTETIDAPIDRDEELRDLLTVPILVGIPVLQTAMEQRKQDWRWRAEVATVSVLLALIPAMTLFTYYRG